MSLIEKKPEILSSLQTEIDPEKSIEFANITPEIFNGFWGDLLDSLPEGVLIVSLEKNLLFINKKMIELWEMPLSLKSSLSWLDLAIDKVEEPALFLKRIEEIYSDPHYECQELTKLKTGQILQRTTKPLSINGEILGRIWTYQDISEEFMAEQALRESERNYRILYDAEQRRTQELALLDRIRTLVKEDLEFPLLIQNLIEGLAETFGYSPITCYLLKDDSLHLVDYLGTKAAFNQIPLHSGISGKAVRTGKPILVEDVSQNSLYIDSEMDIISEISVPLFDRENVIGVLNVNSIDEVKLTGADLNLVSTLCEHISGAITRARLYTNLKTKEKQLHNIFDLAPIGKAICEIDGTFVEVNKAFEAVVGYSTQELTQMRFADITHPDEIDNNLEWFNRLITAEISAYSFEKRYIHKNGQPISVFLQVSMIPNQEGQPDRLIAQVIDLTATKRAEDALLQHQKIESIGTLAGGIAHDFNNLLVALKAQSSLALLNLPAGSKARKHIEKTIMAANSAAQLTEQLLVYAGQGQFSVAQLDINDEIHKNIQLLEVAIPKNVKLVHQFTPNLRKIMGDKVRIQQILMNLIINGVESMDAAQADGAGTVTILTEEVEVYPEDMGLTSFALVPPAPGKFIAISIIDTGVGLDEATMKKIFDPFFTTKFTGRGLGLAAVLGIVRSHNGGLCVKSTIGLGTKFKIYFPIAANQTISIAETEIVERPESIHHEQSGQMVLLIDDDELVTETMLDIFQLENIPTICATNGSDGIVQLKSNKDRVALVILDLSMPGISSEKTFSELRKINPKIPVLLCSGFSELKISNYFSDQKYEGFIAKPFDINHLLKTVRNFI